MFINSPYRSRPGVAAVELAAVLPLIVMLLLGAIEASRAVMVTHALQEAANAGCRVYSVEEGTKQQALSLISKAMENAGVSGCSVVFDPTTSAEVDVLMEPVTVTVSVPFSQVAWLPSSFLHTATLEGKCVMPADVDISDGGDTNGYTQFDDDHEGDGHERHDDTQSEDDDDD
ncbi:MAG: TadE family protein [Planctomycetota bacterium]